MKSIIISFITFICISITGYSQAKATDKAVIKTPNAACEDCKDFLESRLIREYGVTSVNVNYQKKTTTVTWLTDRTTLENIKVMISYFGFDADDVEADEIAYKKLPACCKRPVVIKKSVVDSVKPLIKIPKLDTPKPKTVISPVKEKG